MRVANLRIIGFFALLFALSMPRAAAAYPWMIRHEYAACAQCHVDPSGGGPLSAYGRGMGEILLKTHYAPVGDEAMEPGPGAQFLWGAVPLPEPLDLGGSFRAMELVQKMEGTALYQRPILMQSDLDATLQFGRWVASVSVGYAPKGGLDAAITRGPDSNLVSRQHWVGYRLDEASTWLVRAGRMNLPFGIRDVMHTLFVRMQTRTNIDDEQQHGVALSYSGSGFRGELMGIAGNFQIRPDDYRERGYTGYLEWQPTTQAAVGVSSRIAHVELDPYLLRPAYRHAHGLFARWVTPWSPVVVLSEADYVVDSFKDIPRTQGLAAMGQVDFEPIQGIHYQLTGEATDVGPHGSGFTYSGWASFLWFCLSHVDVRLDAIVESIDSPVGATKALVMLGQAHVYL